jgi:hypothetical protein
LYATTRSGFADRQRRHASTWQAEPTSSTHPASADYAETRPALLSSRRRQHRFTKSLQSRSFFRGSLARDGSFVLVHADGSGERTLPHNIRVRKLALSPGETKAFFEETEGYLSKVGILDLRAVRPGD